MIVVLGYIICALATAAVTGRVLAWYAPRAWPALYPDGFKPDVDDCLLVLLYSVFWPVTITVGIACLAVYAVARALGATLHRAVLGRTLRSWVFGVKRP